MARLKSSFLVILILCLINESYEIGCDPSYNGTTPDFEEIFLGRCYYFVNVLHKNDCGIQAKNISCSNLYESFVNAVVNKSSCDIQMSDYQEFLIEADHPIGVNSTLFWSGTYGSAHELTRIRNFWSLEDTLSGYLLNELTFCSELNSSSFTKTCQSDCIQYNNPFWNAASRDFASKARGYIGIVLNGTRTQGAISNTSTFFRHELPQLYSFNVKRIKVVLLHQPGVDKYETCEKPKTLTVLKAELEKKGIEYVCEDNPDEVLLLMCFQNPSSKECQRIQSLINSSSSIESNGLFWNLCSAILAILAIKQNFVVVI